MAHIDEEVFDQYGKAIDNETIEENFDYFMTAGESEDGFVHIGSLTYSVARVLSAVDPIALRETVLGYLDYQFKDTEDMDDPTREENNWFDSEESAAAFRAKHRDYFVDEDDDE